MRCNVIWHDEMICLKIPSTLSTVYTWYSLKIHREFMTYGGLREVHVPKQTISMFLCGRSQCTIIKFNNLNHGRSRCAQLIIIINFSHGRSPCAQIIIILDLNTDDLHVLDHYSYPISCQCMFTIWYQIKRMMRCLNK